MNGWLKWLPWFRKPVFVPGPKPADDGAGRLTHGYSHAAKSPHIVHAPELFECDCGRQHPNGWICNSPHRDTL